MKQVKHKHILFSLMLLGGMKCKSNSETIGKVETSHATYYTLSDGTWESNGLSYKYKLEISGKIANSDIITTFVYLSNIAEITFEQACKAANKMGYFAIEDAVLVDVREGIWEVKDVF